MQPNYNMDAAPTPSAAQPDYSQLVERIAETHRQGQARAYQAVNTTMLETYWQIGQYLVEFEQGGQAKAGYGEQLLKRLSQDLTRLLGKGFSRNNLSQMRMLYVRYPICQTMSDKLSWSHYVEFIKVDDPFERSFYEKQTLREGWNVRELRR